MSYSQAKYGLVLNDALQLQQESSDYEYSSSTGVAVAHQPPSYISVVDQRAPSRNDSYRSPGIQESITTQSVHNPRDIPITNQPREYMTNTRSAITSQPRRPWKTGLCDCCESSSVCMCVTCCSCCYACFMAKKMNEHSCLACCPGGLAIMRSNFRKIHNIEGSSMDDVCLTIWCRSCILCQMGNEMDQAKYPKFCCGCC